MSAVPEQSDAELLAATAAGDRAAFEVLYRRYGPWLAARLRYRCSDARPESSPHRPIATPHQVEPPGTTAAQAAQILGVPAPATSSAC